MFRGSLVACLALLVAVAASADPVVLKDVPPTSWDRPNLPISILHTALAGLGCPMPYEDLMVLSGSAFRMCWRPGDFNYPVTRLSQQDQVVLGGAAAGAQVQRVPFATVEQAYDAAADSIDKGCPVIAWDSGKVDTQVICGYDEAKQTLFRRNINTGAVPDEKPAECLKSPGPGYGANAPYELWIITYDRTKPLPKPNWPYLLAGVLRMAQWPDADRLYSGYVVGDCAYYSWATDLRSTTTYTKYPSPGQLTWDWAWQLEKSRRHVANVLQANLGVHPAFGQAAMMYQDEAALFGKVQETLCGGTRLAYRDAMGAAAQNIKEDKLREACADLIEQALAKNRAARAQLRLALKDLAPDLLPVEDAQPAQK